jgi:D-3-phosphoglycerate dehydrogenase
MARNQFNGTSGSELKEKTLGIHAYGYVGKIVAHIAKGFGMEINAFDPFLEDSVFEEDEITRVTSVEDLYRSSQYVSLHIPANEKTRKSINYDLLSLMPEGAVLVNTARKEVIDEDALARIMKERSDFRYVSDIVPDNGDNLKSEYPDNCFFTPKKMGAQTSEANVNAGVAAAEQIVAFFKTGDTAFRVN